MPETPVLGPRKHWCCCLWHRVPQWYQKKTVQDLLLFVFCGFTSTSAQLKTSPFLTMCRIVATATSARMKKWKSVNAICLSHEAVRFPWIRRNYIYGGMDSTLVWCASVSGWPYLCRLPVLTLMFIITILKTRRSMEKGLDATRLSYSWHPELYCVPLTMGGL